MSNNNKTRMALRVKKKKKKKKMRELVSIFPVHKSIRTFASLTGTCHAQTPGVEFQRPFSQQSRLIYDNRVQSDFSMAPKSSTPNNI